NYDLPWNPMMIEQRIGRVDRIGQKKKVQAYNMLTNNSVDLRVYEVIEEKLNNIIEQFGIDKTSDVLDSAIDLKKVNKLYLQSLLNPERFDFASDQWLNEIKGKLKDYKSTEGVLPQVRESEINYKKAAEIKHSPLPYWLETLIEQYTITQNGSVIKNHSGYSEVHLQNKTKKISFDAEVSLDNPGVEHISLQHDWIRKILNGIGEFDQKNGIPVITSENEDETPGYWSLWQISAKNSFESKIQYQSFFISDSGKQYIAYANDIWNRLIGGATNFTVNEIQTNQDISQLERTLNDSLYIVFQNLESEVLNKMSVKKENRINSYNFQKSRINKIGIDNIRHSKLVKLEREQDEWMKEFKMENKVIPGIKQLLTIRVNG
ncbi:MAG TPA: hypothetical protein VKY45_01705, partial [Marinilabiliaceae bacterium]|nr:hypothetical protein [Marinilabiliaceae bacterium]